MIECGKCLKKEENYFICGSCLDNQLSREEKLNKNFLKIKNLLISELEAKIYKYQTSKATTYYKLSKISLLKTKLDFKLKQIKELKMLQTKLNKFIDIKLNANESTKILINKVVKNNKNFKEFSISNTSKEIVINMTKKAINLIRNDVITKINKYKTYNNTLLSILNSFANNCFFNNFKYNNISKDSSEKEFFEVIFQINLTSTKSIEDSNFKFTQLIETNNTVDNDYILLTNDIISNKKLNVKTDYQNVMLNEKPVYEFLNYIYKVNFYLCVLEYLFHIDTSSLIKCNICNYFDQFNIYLRKEKLSNSEAKQVFIKQTKKYFSKILEILSVKAKNIFSYFSSIYFSKNILSTKIMNSNFFDINLILLLGQENVDITLDNFLISSSVVKSFTKNNLKKILAYIKNKSQHKYQLDSENFFEITKELEIRNQEFILISEKLSFVEKYIK